MLWFHVITKLEDGLTNDNKIYIANYLTLKKNFGGAI